jgi:hypothetical protein
MSLVPKCELDSISSADGANQHSKGFSQAVFAVFLGMRDQMPELFLADGRWSVAKCAFPNTVILPGFAAPQEVELLRQHISSQPDFKRAEMEGLLQVPDDSTFGDLPKSLTENLTSRLNNLMAEALSFRRDHTKELDGMYAQFARLDTFQEYRFEEVVRRAFQKDLEDLSMGARYAIFAALRKNEGRHTILRTKFNALNIFFTPRNLYKQIVEVTGWARQYQDCAARAANKVDVSEELRQNPLNTFINKARRIIRKSREIRLPTTIGSLGPCKNGSLVRSDGSVVTRETGEKITSEDLSVLEFMWNTYLRRPSAYQDVVAKSIGALILRAIGAYPKMQLNLSIARLFFREMGLGAPWSEEMDDDLRIPASGRRGAFLAQRLIRETDKMSDTLGFTTDPTKIPLEDNMAALRKDWGDMNIYAIDKSSAGILDDAISLEDSTDIPGATWVHVHIAHPAAFLKSNSVFRDRAETLTSAIYTTAKLYPMLPQNMSSAFSLRANSPVLTVSSLVLKDGEVKDVKVTVGTIRKLIRLEPDKIAAVLGVKPVEQSILQVGPAIKYPSHDMSNYQEAEKHSDFIRKLNSIKVARSAKRKEEIPDYPKWLALETTQVAQISWTEAFDGYRHTRSYHYLGDPTIKITSPRFKDPISYHKNQEDSDDLNKNMMVLAGESIGRWLRQRNIPVIYSAAVPVDEVNSVAHLNETHDQIGAQLTPRAMSTSKPVGHALMGLAQYVKITSPLRRYGDCLAQWQIDAYLQAEAEGRLPASGDLSDVLPFTADQIDCIIQDSGDTSKLLNVLHRKSMVHWSMQAIFRAFHFGEAPLPAIWDAQVSRTNIKIPHSPSQFQEVPDTADLTGFLRPFFLRTLFLKSKEGWEVGVKRFQYLPVKIEYVDTTNKNVYVRAVGPPSDKVTQSGRVHCVKPENEEDPFAK